MSIFEVLRSPMFRSLMKANNPQIAINNMLNSNPQIANNQIAQNALRMANEHDTAGIENMARNLYKERGIDINQAYNEILSYFGK